MNLDSLRNIVGETNIVVTTTTSVKLNQKNRTTKEKRELPDLLKVSTRKGLIGVSYTDKLKEVCTIKGLPIPETKLPKVQYDRDGLLLVKGDTRYLPFIQTDTVSTEYRTVSGDVANITDYTDYLPPEVEKESPLVLYMILKEDSINSYELV